MESFWSRFPTRSLLTGILVYLGIQASVIGIASIGGSSEAREALVVDVIVRDGSWVLPLRNGIIPSKPPLYHWLGASLSLLLGEVSEFSVRFTSQLAAAVVLLFVAVTTYRFAYLAGPRLTSTHVRCSVLGAAGITSLSYGFFVMANQAMVDMTFTLCVWGALASLAMFSDAEWITRRRISEGARCGFFFFCGLGVLARGPLGFVLPVFLAFIAGCVALGLRNCLREFFRVTLAWSFILIPLTWYYLAYRQGGDAFLERQIVFENFKRFSGGEHVNSESWWFYVPSFLRTTFPWGVLLALVWFVGLRSAPTLSYPSARRSHRWLPTILCLCGIAMFSLSSGKRHSYLLPLVPLVSIQLAVELSRLFELGGDRVKTRALKAGRRLLSFNTALVVVLLGGGAILAGFDYDASPRAALAIPPLLAVVEHFGVILVAVVAVGSLVKRHSHGVVFQSIWFQYAAFLSLATNTGTAIKAHLKGYDEMAAVWLSLATSDDDLAVVKHPFDEYFDPILYYVKRPVRVLSTENPSFECERRVLYVAKRDWVESRARNFGLSITSGTILRERLLAQAQDGRRDIVVFRCDVEGSDSTQSVSPPAMKEATHQGTQAIRKSSPT